MTAKQAKEKGIKKAEDGANAAVENWSDTAYEYLLEYLQTVHTFLTEDFRAWCLIEKGFDAPNSQRAFGGVVRRAKHNKLISHWQAATTTNPLAHQCWASAWIVLPKINR